MVGMNLVRIQRIHCFKAGNQGDILTAGCQLVNPDLQADDPFRFFPDRFQALPDRLPGLFSFLLRQFRLEIPKNNMIYFDKYSSIPLAPALPAPIAGNGITWISIRLFL